MGIQQGEEMQIKVIENIFNNFLKIPNLRRR
jgi:hypothetical protein